MMIDAFRGDRRMLIRSANSEVFKGAGPGDTNRQRLYFGFPLTNTGLIVWLLSTATLTRGVDKCVSLGLYQCCS